MVTRVDEHLKKMKEFKSRIMASSNNERIFIEFYKYIKFISNYYFHGYAMDSDFKQISYFIAELEQNLPNGYILESTPIFEKPILGHNPSCEEILDYIVNSAKETIAKRRNEDVMSCSFINYCCDASIHMEEICVKLGIDYKYIDLEPGFSKDYKLFDGNGYHYFIIAKINGKEYLLDPTYRQFFTKSYNILERIGVVYTSGCQSGRFMLMYEERLNVAKTLLKRGWIELTDNVIKAYFDGFTISYRNGLYYEETQDYSYTTNYTADDYRNFLAGLDNQINHEGANVLGYQLKPCTNNLKRCK